jgi:integrase
MPARRKLGLREIAVLAPGTIAWDTVVSGFGARRQRDAISFILKYRTTSGRQRWFTIGKLGSPWTPDLARREAQRLLLEIRRGADPTAEKLDRRTAITVEQLCRRYLADAEAGRLLIRGGQPKKPSTLATDKSRIEGHLIPLLGRLPVASVTRQDVERSMHAIAEGETRSRLIRGGRGAARRTINLLGAIFTFAIEQQLRADNPCRGVRRYSENRRERRLSDAEYSALGAALRGSEFLPQVIGAVRFLCLTGWRCGEALHLRWQDVDLARRTAILADTKTGRSIRPLSQAACNVLQNQSRLLANELVFPSSRGMRLTSFTWQMRRATDRAGLPSDISAHVLRHSFASLAADLGYSDATIGSLIGHRGQSVTSRYMHFADGPLLAAADAVADATAERMGDALPSGVVVPMRA